MNNKTLKIFVAVFFIVVLGIGLLYFYQNYKDEQTDLQNNYIETNAEITFIGKMGTGINTKAKLGVKYVWENENYTGFVMRTYKKEEYYNKGDTIKIYINKNNIKQIK